jgi:hypothetical protein
VSQKLGVGAAGLSEGIPQNRQAVLVERAVRERTMLVGGVRQLPDCAIVPTEPRRVGVDLAERQGTENLPKKFALSVTFLWQTFSQNYQLPP